MKVLFALLVVSVAAIMVTVVAMWLRLRWHLRRSNKGLQHALGEIQPEHESLEPK
ncbi:MAG: hypothetical protein LAO20_01830 [Acidobacteriia bacterium]|nr:hypothetical protein [Terriglobia bacterium]